MKTKQKKITTKLLGKEVFKDGSWVFQLVRPKPKKVIRYIPYPDN